jgi:hypothetical protein
MPALLPGATGISPSPELRKSVAVLVRRPVEQAPDVEEALRVALGQTLAAGRVIVAFVGPGVWAAAAPPLSVEPTAGIETHLGMLVELGQELLAEAGALEARGIRTVRNDVLVRPRRELLARLAQADALLVL